MEPESTRYSISVHKLPTNFERVAIKIIDEVIEAHKTSLEEQKAQSFNEVESALAMAFTEKLDELDTSITGVSSTKYSWFVIVGRSFSIHCQKFRDCRHFSAHTDKFSVYAFLNK